jgi:hypothetical protein
LEGTYTPANYLEEPVELEGTDCTATITDCRIEVSFHEPELLPDADRQAAVSREVNQVFNTHMILTGRSAEVSALTLKRRRPDGKAESWVSVSVSSCLSEASVCSPDIITTDAGGNVVRDTKAERLADEKAFREQCLRHAEDLLLKELMASFRQAIADPADQMMHFYEIRDALSRHFGGDKEARKVLGLTSKEWSDFGRITNDEPIEQSRHRGNHPVRRPATEEEMARIIDVARRMIRAYIDRLDSTSAP